ncbi:MAG: ribbon-helix-helix protein, CopG family [Acidobacteria bacterium]|nr:ribbon-helix-helix protein, CopG family [Acidobacteriota bacterium]
MSTHSTFSIRIPVGTVKKLEALASSMDRSRTYVVNEAIEQYLAVQSWQIAEIRQGLEEADKGGFASDGEVKEVFARHEAGDAG